MLCLIVFFAAKINNIALSTSLILVGKVYNTIKATRKSLLLYQFV